MLLHIRPDRDTMFRQSKIVEFHVVAVTSARLSHSGYLSLRTVLVVVHALEAGGLAGETEGLTAGGLFERVLCVAVALVRVVAGGFLAGEVFEEGAHGGDVGGDHAELGLDHVPHGTRDVGVRYIKGVDLADCPESNDASDTHYSTHDKDSRKLPFASLGSVQAPNDWHRHNVNDDVCEEEEQRCNKIKCLLVNAVTFLFTVPEERCWCALERKSKCSNEIG